jgi:murein DD-endopeptidase MepM/ murein hydrolase activator NlpD
MAVWLGSTVALADPGKAVLERTERGATLLDTQARASEQLARLQARAAYRLARRQQLGFLPRPDERGMHAHALDTALLALSRSVAEAKSLRDERDRLRAQARALTKASARLAASGASSGRPVFARPCRGSIMGETGRHRDPGTGVELPVRAAEILGRMNDPVLTPAAGTVRRVEALPEGGYGVVLEHAHDWVTVLEGLRSVSVKAGQALPAGAQLGVVGRNLDGAPLITIEVSHGGQPQDPRLVFP